MTDKNERSDIGYRFAEIRDALGITNATAMSKRLGIGVNAWRTYEEGLGTPSWSTLSKLAELGFNVAWIISGSGDMRTPQSSQPGIHIDRDLMARVTEMVVRAHKEAGSHLADGNLGRLSIEIYAEILRKAEGPEDYAAETELAANRLRRKLAQAAAEPGTGKRSA